MRARRSAWSDPEVQQLLTQFVPVADEVHRLQRSEDAEGLWFRGLSEAGHYAGRTTPTDTRQGIYAATPSGELLASRNTTSRERIVELLMDALAGWRLADREGRLGQPASVAAPRRPEARYPADGLALVVHARDLEKAGEPDDWRTAALNRDRAWFSAEEARALVPEASAGATRVAPEPLVRRLARLHLVDFVRGQTSPFGDDQIQAASLLATTETASEHRIEIRFEGSFRMEGPGLSENSTRGFAPILLGRATWSRQMNRFEAFEWVAAGPRWGGTKYNERGNDRAPRPLGLVFALADPGDRVPPAFIWAYPR